MPGERQRIEDGLGDGWREWGHHVLQSLKRLEDGQNAMGEKMETHLAEQDLKVEHVRQEVDKVRRAAAYSKGKVVGLSSAIGVGATAFFFLLSKIWPVLHK